jgi:hypothetical protein
MLKLPHYLDNQLRDDGEAVSLMHQPPFTPRKIPGTHFCSRLSRPQGHSAAGKIGSIKKSMISSGIEHTTFLFVAQCLNQLCYCAPHIFTSEWGNQHQLSTDSITVLFGLAYFLFSNCQSCTFNCWVYELLSEDNPQRTVRLEQRLNGFTSATLNICSICYSSQRPRNCSSSYDATFQATAQSSSNVSGTLNATIYYFPFQRIYIYIM